MRLRLICCVLASCLLNRLALRKVVVPAVFHEWDLRKPNWATDRELQKFYGYSVYTYQKLDATKPYYFSSNRGTETGVYLKYIVDHYDKFPDIAVFVHAHPHDHQKNWLEMVRAISANATYYNLNDPNEWVRRTPAEWRPYSVTMEQCWRDIIQIAWGLLDQDEAFRHRLPPSVPVTISAVCCNQFLLSRSMVHRRPLQVWQQLLTKIALQPACHLGEPDYESLHEFNATDRVKCGPEADLHFEGLYAREHEVGQLIPGMTGEHLSHVIFGQQALDALPLPPEEACYHFIRDAHGSPCVSTDD